MSELMIMVAPNGARRGKEDHPALPITPSELADTAMACRAAGAGAFHLHVRDDAGRHSISAAAYRTAIAAIKARFAGDLAIQITTEAAGLFDINTQISTVEELRPAAVSFSIAEMLRDGEDRAVQFLRRACEAGTAFQFILYSPEEIRLLARLWRMPHSPIPERPSVIVVVGRYTETQDSSVEEFDRLHNALVETGLAESAVWMTCAFGRGELACLERSIALGGHARVGFENAITDAQGRPARDNAERVALVAELAARHGRPPADVSRCAALLGMKQVGALLS